MHFAKVKGLNLSLSSVDLGLRLNFRICQLSESKQNGLLRRLELIPFNS